MGNPVGRGKIIKSVCVLFLQSPKKTERKSIENSGQIFLWLFKSCLILFLLCAVA